MKAKITVEMRLKRYTFFLVEFILFWGLNKPANPNTNINTINPKNGNIFTVSILLNSYITTIIQLVSY